MSLQNRYLQKLLLYLPGLVVKTPTESNRSDLPERTYAPGSGHKGISPGFLSFSRIHYPKGLKESTVRIRSDLPKGTYAPGSGHKEISPGY